MTGVKPMSRPTVGRTVHYTSYGTPGGEFPSECRAAIVTESDASGIGLCVLNPTGMFFNRQVPYDDLAEVPGDPNCMDRAEHGVVFRYCSCGWLPATPRGGSWHWPERAAQ